MAGHSRTHRGKRSQKGGKGKKQIGSYNVKAVNRLPKKGEQPQRNTTKKHKEQNALEKKGEKRGGGLVLPIVFARGEKKTRRKKKGKTRTARPGQKREGDTTFLLARGALKGNEGGGQGERTKQRGKKG